MIKAIHILSTLGLTGFNMLLKDLINQLQDLYATYDDDYKHVAGEPDIVVDVFTPQMINGVKCFAYAGFSQQVILEKTDDGVYNIINAFSTRIDINKP